MKLNIWLPIYWCLLAAIWPLPLGRYAIAATLAAGLYLLGFFIGRKD